MAKLLLVEDDNNLREIYEARLTAEGYEIITAQNGEEALSAAKQHKPDLIISDVMMPRISGFEMLDILRNTNELRHTKVIMLTALGQSEDRNRADNLGADKYLVKSQVTLEDIVNAAKALLSDEPGDMVVPTTPQMVSPAAPAPAVIANPVPPAQPLVVAEPIIEPATVSATEPTIITLPADPLSQPLAAPLPASDSTSTTGLSASSQPVMVPIPKPVVPAADEQVIDSEPPVATPVMALATSDEVSTDHDETASMDTTVTVTDPDPIVPRISPQAEPLASEDFLAETPIDTVALPEPATPPDPKTDLSVSPPEPYAGPQTLADEEAAIQAQIASFAANDQPQEAAPTHNDAVLNDAISKLTAVPESTQSTSEATQAALTEPASTTDKLATETSDAPDQPGLLQSPTTTGQISGRKVIQPLTGAVASTTNLEELLALESAKEAASTEESPRPIVSSEPGDAEDQRDGIDPDSIAL